MVNFGNVVVAYAVIGVMMWGGGAITWSDAGLGNVLIDDPEGGEVNEGTLSDLQGIGSVLSQVLDSVGASGLLVVWSIVSKVLGFLFWPITVLATNDAPAQVTALLGGGLSMTFLGSLLMMLRGV